MLTYNDNYNGYPESHGHLRPWKLIRWRCSGDGSHCAKVPFLAIRDGFFPPIDDHLWR